MFTATRVAAVVSFVVLGSGLALSGLVGGPADEAIGPPGAEAQMVGSEWAFFSGTLTAGAPAAGGQTTVENGMSIALGTSFSGERLETNDSRMTGTRTQTFNHFSFRGDDDSPAGEMWRIVAVIQNEGGTWTCDLTALTSGDAYGETGWCEGVGDYEGLRAFVVFDLNDPEGRFDVAGYITSGDGPPLPDVSAE